LLINIEPTKTNKPRGVGVQQKYTFRHSSPKVPRIMHGKQQELETLINEEALLLARFLLESSKLSFIVQYSIIGVALAVYGASLC
jgi:hypothetical protein